MKNGRLSGSAERHSGTMVANRPASGAAKPLSKIECAMPPLDETAILSGVRQVDQTHDGRKIGHVEPLETERAVRIAVSRRVNMLTVSQPKARDRSVQKRKSVKAAIQRNMAAKASATKRGKGKREAVRG